MIYLGVPLLGPDPSGQAVKKHGLLKQKPVAPSWFKIALTDKQSVAHKQKSGD